MGELRFEDEFNSRFHQYKDQRVAVYGTGDNARLIAEFITGYHIIGFITKNPEQESVFGKLLLSIDEAIYKNQRQSAVTNSYTRFLWKCDE